MRDSSQDRNNSQGVSIWWKFVLYTAQIPTNILYQASRPLNYTVSYTI
jgi:hypothetical protein